MKLYLISLAAGLLVGVIYALLNVRSPAPPVVALIGLFGILIGEQIPPFVKDYVQHRPELQTLLSHQVRPHVFGDLPRGRSVRDAQLAQPERTDTTTQR